MTWETRNGFGRYYTRSRRINGHVTREYVGIGDKGEAAAAEDQRQRLARQEEKNHLAHYILQSSRHQRALNGIEHLGNLYLESILSGASYHLHRNAEWRKRRDL